MPIVYPAGVTIPSYSGPIFNPGSIESHSYWHDNILYPDVKIVSNTDGIHFDPQGIVTFFFGPNFIVDGESYDITTLPADFGLSEISMGTDGLGNQSPLVWAAGSGTALIDPHLFTAVGNEFWRLDSLGLWLQTDPSGGFDGSVLTFGDPYTLTPYPPVPTVWNGGLANFFVLQVYANLSELGQRNAAALNISDSVPLSDCRLVATADSYPPPTSPRKIIMPMGSKAVNPDDGSGSAANIDLGGAFETEILMDASGIYTLTPSLFMDNLYQRVGTTSHTVLSTKIPDPFVKTAFFGE